MKISISGNDILFTHCEVSVNTDSICRQFEIISTSHAQEYKIGEKVEIRLDNGQLVIRAEIEYVSIVGVTFTYAGRNATKNLIKSYADKTIQFSKGESVRGIIERFAQPFDIKVLGAGNVPLDTIPTVFVGDNLAVIFMQIARLSGCVLYSDPVGNIVIETKPKAGTLHYEYGKNISSRTLVHNTTEQCEKYLVFSQSNRSTAQDALTNIQGSFGSGKTTKVIVPNSNLNAFECEALAKYEYNRDVRKAYSYTATVDLDMIPDINTTQTVTDRVVGITSHMLVVGYVIAVGLKSSEVHISFQKDTYD